MVDQNHHYHHRRQQTVCCMCGDVGFPEKLFACKRCRFRYQHSYCCSNLYAAESSSDKFEICEWCQSEQTNNTSTPPTTINVVVTSPRHNGNTSARKHANTSTHHHVHNNSSSTQTTATAPVVASTSTSTSGRSPATTGVPSPRQGTRRYKLLKDVMC